MGVDLGEPGEGWNRSAEPPAHGAGQLRAAHGDERGTGGGPERRHGEPDDDDEPDHGIARSTPPSGASTGGR